MKHTFVIGSRGSRLALAQTNLVADLLRAAVPGITVRVEIISTKGDQFVDRPLIHVEGKGLFTKELEVALLDGRIDLAVHSMKDLPTDLPEGLTVGAVPSRANPHDALVSASGGGLDDLPEGATVGTSSLRRRAQLLAHRPDLIVVDLRGNVDTRLRRVREGYCDATVLACSGLERLGLADVITETLSPDVMVPAPAQGALAIEMRADDADLREVLRAITEAATEAEVAAERALLSSLGGGCRVPIGALARVEGEDLILVACVCDADGKNVLRTFARGRMSESLALGRRAAQLLLADGAAPLIEAIRLEDEGNPFPLRGKRIVVTRARAQADALTEGLEALGAEIFEFPTIEIQPVEKQPELIGSERFDWLILTSANATQTFFAQVDRQAWDLGALVTNVAVIGPATAQAVRERGVPIDLMPEKHTAESLCEALMAREPSLEGKRILLPRSDIARPFLPDELRRHGATVTEWVLYHTVCPDVPDETIAALMQFAPDLVVFTSSSTARHFCQLLGPDRLEQLKRSAAFASMGPATTKTARGLGLRIAIEPAQHDVAGLVQAIKDAHTG